ncbi:MAG: alpha/beta fold hydrolase [Cyclobacteriaceae bacterium]|jgi:pimeloyl-ACP methyl ester carboxylesterase|nr:alpha/beta fold hydrolase [Cyclobacteriaceae bacterium]
MELFYRELGQGSPLIILHGLFGSSDNWYSLSKIFAEKYKVYVIDQRNHGQSPHDAVHDYEALTDDLNEFIESHNIKMPIIIGHSMGGKTAMNFAIRFPEKLSKLIIVDIVPKAYPVHHDSILEGLNAIDLSQLESRGQADEILGQFVPEPPVRQFLLKNLARDKDQNFEWKINIPVLEAHIDDMGVALRYEGQFEGPTLFIVGAKSNYFEAGDEALIKSYFPDAKIATLNTGHWVQAENPKDFMETVFNFVSK